jgi:hypothetical protein
MSIEIICDGRGCRAKGFEVCYCEDCYLSLEKELDKANERIAELESREVSNAGD